VKALLCCCAIGLEPGKQRHRVHFNRGLLFLGLDWATVLSDDLMLRVGRRNGSRDGARLPTIDGEFATGGRDYFSQYRRWFDTAWVPTARGDPD
jgi:hypothetical protein